MCYMDFYKEKSDLLITDTNVISDIIKYCIDVANLDYVVYDKKIYLPHCTAWYGPNKNLYNIEKFNVYEGYDEHECTSFSSVYPENSDQVKYIISYDKHYEFNDNYNYPELMHAINYLSPSNIFLRGYDKIVFINKNKTINDHRGSNHCDVELDSYEEFIVNNKDIRLSNFAHAFYRIKNHKWDHQYEYYDGFNTYVINNTLYIEILFIHNA